jgi:hypothetical protein
MWGTASFPISYFLFLFFDGINGIYTDFENHPSSLFELPPRQAKNTRTQGLRNASM